MHGFRTTSTEVLEAIVGSSRLVKLPPHRSVYREGDEATIAYIVERGLVNRVADRKDRRIQLPRAYPGDWLGLAEVIEGSQGDSVYSHSAITTRDPVRLLAIRKEDISRLMRMPEFGTLIALQISKEIRTAHDVLSDLSYGHLHYKVVSYLARQMAKLQDAYPGQEPSWMETHLEIAKSIGAGRESVTRALLKLKKEGVLGSPPSHPSVIVITNPEKLLELQRKNGLHSGTPHVKPKPADSPSEVESSIA